MGVRGGTIRWTTRTGKAQKALSINTLKFHGVRVGDNWQDNAHSWSAESTINQNVEISQRARWKNLVANEHR